MSEEDVEIVRGTRIAPIPLPESAGRRRRSLDERLFVRFPALYRLLGDALMRVAAAISASAVDAHPPCRAGIRGS